MAPGADPLAALRDIREPAPTVETLLADAIMALAAGLLLAVVIAFLARLLLRRRHSRREAALAALQAMRHLEAEDRLFAQASVFKHVASDIPLDQESVHGGLDRRQWTARLDGWLGSPFFTNGTGAKLRESLYRRDKTVDPELVDKELIRLLRRARD